METVKRTGEFPKYNMRILISNMRFLKVLRNLDKARRLSAVFALELHSLNTWNTPILCKQYHDNAKKRQKSVNFKAIC